uniref:Leukocyte immunoglobulin-like receptor, subfamily B, member 4B n=1 Tax=Mus musculus TaxID=10090 RepID=A0A1W2P6Y5_MOUSE
MIAMLTVLLYLGELLFWNPGLQYRQIHSDTGRKAWPLVDPGLTASGQSANPCYFCSGCCCSQPQWNIQMLWLL